MPEFSEEEYYKQMLDDDSIARAREEAAKQRQTARYGLAGQQIAKAFSGSKQDPAFWNQMLGDADRLEGEAQSDRARKLGLLNAIQKSRRQREEMDMKRQSESLQNQYLREKLSLQQQGLDEKKAARMAQDSLRRQELSMEDKADQSRLVPGMGYALTKDDAKKMKEAQIQKAKFDRQLKEMMDLREKYGAEVLNRDAVARGKALSKDLLLTYKNLAKLGVLSKSDEDIVNAIIPADPLAFTASNILPSGIVGEDPVMTKLRGLSRGIDEDFKSTIAARMEGGDTIAAGMPEKPKAIVESGTAIADEGPKAPDGMVLMKAPDGSVRAVPRDKVEKYRQKGATLLEN